MEQDKSVGSEWFVAGGFGWIWFIIILFLAFIFLAPFICNLFGGYGRW